MNMHRFQSLGKMKRRFKNNQIILIVRINKRREANQTSY